MKNKSTMSKTLYILYNADASLMGKVKYSYKKICRTDGNPECAACQITHGGLSLNETSEWSKAKKELESEENIKVVQWHRDELSDQVYINASLFFSLHLRYIFKDFFVYFEM